MVDKVTLFLPMTRELSEHRRRLRRRLDNVRTIKKTNRRGFRGELESISVSFSDNGISIVGSLGKFLNGENLTNIDRNGIKRAIDKLSKKLGFEVNDAKVTSMEIGMNFKVKRPVSYYLPYFADFPRAERVQLTTTSIRFDAKEKKIAIYGKVEEMMNDKKMKGKIPLDVGNVLRLEVRLNRPARQLGWSGIDASTLYTEKFYNNLKTFYLGQYSMIKKTGRITTKSRNIEKPSDGCNALFASAIAIAGGQQFVDAFIAGMRAENPRIPAFYRAIRNILYRKLGIKTAEENVFNEIEAQLKRLGDV